MKPYEIYSDEIERTVLVRINEAEKAPMYRYDKASSTVHYFRPVEALVRFSGETLTQVSLRGPQVIKNGALHATRWASWNWPWVREGKEDVASIWEADPPLVLQEILAELGVLK